MATCLRERAGDAEFLKISPASSRGDWTPVATFSEQIGEWGLCIKKLLLAA
jgi:hypothetical protein